MITLGDHLDGTEGYATRATAWAIGRHHPHRIFRVRRIVWGLMLARAERRPGEQIRRATIFVEKVPIK